MNFEKELQNKLGQHKQSEVNLSPNNISFLSKR